jgi:hypothetical protein
MKRYWSPFSWGGLAGLLAVGYTHFISPIIEKRYGDGADFAIVVTVSLILMSLGYWFRKTMTLKPEGKRE